MRFTVKENDFYVITLNWSDKVLVKSLSKEVVGDAEILNIKLLGSDEAIDWKLTEEGLALRFPSEKPCEFAYAFKISFDKEVGENLPSEATNEVMRHGG